MKANLTSIFVALALLGGVHDTAAQGTAFTYQGRLNGAANPVTGTYDLTFALFNAGSGGGQAGGTITNSGLVLSNGQFIVTLDFGANFPGADRWLEIGVHTNGGGAFTTLSPRQKLTPAPYAITAAGLSGAIPLAQLPSTVLTNHESGVVLGNLTLDGAFSLPDTATGPDTILSGSALLMYADGHGNFFNGQGAGNLTVYGVFNTGVGDFALAGNIGGNYNTAGGYRALFADTYGCFNAGNGFEALQNNTIGNYNTASGYQALFGLNGGNNNIGLGSSAGANVTTGGDNIEIYDRGSPSDNATIRIGTQGVQTNTLIAGISGVTAASGVAVYVNSSGQLGTLTSSRRFKEDIRGMDQASDVLYALKPVTFKYRPGLDPQGTPQFGLVAEDVAKVAPELVARDDRGNIYTVRYQAVDAMLLNEFLKEHQRVEAQNEEIEVLKAKTAQMDSLQKQLNKLAATVKQLAGRAGNDRGAKTGF